MKFITAHLYKPERVLYYIKPTLEQKNAFYLGNIPDVLMKYNGAFGTYDCPGLFLLKNGTQYEEVLGIEYRPDDPQVEYPKDLDLVFLKSSFLISALDTEDKTFDDSELKDSISYLKENLKDKQFQHGIVLGQELDVIQFFTNNGTNRMYLSAVANNIEEFFSIKKPENPTEEELINLAYKDLITDHYNWNYIWPTIAGFGVKGIQDFAFVHFDVKDYNSINIMYGHDVGNKVLKRIVEHMKNQDWIYFSARCHNDNFAMMIKDMPEKEMKEKLMSFFDEISVLEEDKHHHIYYRCGVVPMRNTLLLGDRVADAGKQVQALGTKGYETEVLFYTDQMQTELVWTTKIKEYMDIAIEKDEFIVYLQPKYDLETETIYGAEALARWMYHGRELMQPSRFIPIFEASGLISKLDDIVLKKVCEKFREWKAEDFPLRPISINLSRRRMGDPNLVEHLTEIVDSYGVDHSLIDFELTETAAYSNERMMINIIMGLKNKGFKISMDDFGTGFSTLSLLTTMPMDTIKIDKSFIDKTCDDEVDASEEQSKARTLMKNIIRMAKELKFTCLTEGAETESQIKKLKEYGCEIVQGFYYSKPLPISDYENLIKAVEK